MLLLVRTLTMLEKKKKKEIKEEVLFKYFTIQLMPFSVQLHTSQTLFFNYFFHVS